MNILVTGAAGFIGFHLIKALLQIQLPNSNNCIVGIDNINDYYDVSLKKERLKLLNEISETEYFTFIKLDLADREAMSDLFSTYQFDIVINLGAQAGVRYSIENPNAYIDSNVVGFVNILEGCRHHDIKHLIYASSSSVYGMNIKQPFTTADCVDFPISLYAATKKSNELMAHSYSHLYNIPTTGLRFFTVYGPYGRPDMAYFSFTKKILAGEPINVFNNGDMQRDFTYIDDIVKGIIRIMDKAPSPQYSTITTATAPYKIYNIGNNQPVTLRRFITAIESACGKKAQENLLPMQAGDVPITYADIDELVDNIDFKPDTSIEDGITKFVEWYKQYYSV
ncbi:MULTISPECIES: NAD-dependent epimerase [Psychrobacter]|uniref:NAD-dependent epimerase n=1 Tax=Psychrobacter TaxID=497 RepID=UPI00086C2E25|nr:MULTISPECIES: NAD-dependent epimerase [Psychrobacter]MBA6245308.1 NAD-dependent epimerase [Psychrobacter sp. Urea-trap-18]MBA6285709.1 NAD-dependent epimerase [Psychrobacter sp. Urea-trap-16]MBA6318956.1 NAD-dependent epimerase [Psychrobacter sp. Urea-trap-20]MBA6333903.1 NAD-dependent epimerase [Psychrobacter sp. Urea-trap-19]OEH68918.1 MAG: protein CapI [Psychrobacter sp. B29-1]|tara:strand:- start:5325 stop:6338 length:1014 start_codon:yes stop_codon:yes gene_type:complete